MAEDDKNEEQGEEQGKGKKGLIIIIVAVVIAIAASVGVTVFLLGGDDSAEEAPAEPVEEVKEPLVYFDFKPPILTTFNIGGRARYMQVHLSVASRDQAAVNAVEHHLPLLRSRLNAMYSTQTFSEIQTEEGKQALREATVTLINEVLVAEGEGEIEQVYFSNFVLQ